ncbi:MAG: dihydroorotase [bacterium]|nr:dihydroorotase [bacterium]
MAELTLLQPDDWHLHLRDGAALASVLPDTMQRFARAIIMPNLQPPVTTVEAARAYRERICAAMPAGQHRFEPLMTLYLTDQTTPQEIRRAKASGFIFGVKLYPAGATTHSEAGVTDLAHCTAALEAMQEVGLPLLVHGEVTDPAVDVFDREAAYIERTLMPLLEQLPALKLSLEHMTTHQAVDFVSAARDGVVGTITAQHLLYNRNALFQGGIRPHYYCLPILKRETHRQALLQAATSGNPKIFLGTDSAPHESNSKETACGCAGCYTAYAGIELYAEAFESVNSLDKLEGFASRFGAAFYDLPPNETRITLASDTWTAPHHLPFGAGRITPLRAGEPHRWRLLS